MNSVPSTRLSRRTVLGGLVSASALCLPVLGCSTFRTDQVSATNEPDPSATKIILLGTAGGPPWRANRAPPASVLRVNRENYLIDCGAGTVNQLERAGIAANTGVSRIFITHHHDDHNAGLEALLSLAWTNGRQTPIDVYGPIGTERLVAATVAYADANTRIRTLDEGKKGLSPAQMWRGHDVTPPGLAYQDDNVRVTCIENTHFDVPGQQSLSYRFDAKDRSVVFSGDTGYSTALIGHAMGADVLIHEAIQLDATRPILQRMFEKQGQGTRPQSEIDSVIAHVLTKHTSTEDVGRVASAAGVKLVVLNHLIPGGVERPLLSDEDYAKGVRKNYSGPIIVGRDLQVI